VRFASLLILAALLLSLAPANFANADCGPGSSPECTCIGSTAPFEITFEQPAQLLQPLSATFGNLSLSGGQVVLTANNNYPGISTITPRLFEPISSVTLVDPVPFSLGSYNYATYVAPEPIPVHTVTTLAPIPSLPFPTPTTYSPPVSNGVLSINLVHGYVPAWSSGVTLTVMAPDLPIVTSSGNLFFINYNSNPLPELLVPEPSTLVFFTLGLILAAGLRPQRANAI
jgi:hypothetical protein